jgi:hypothetical protein
MKRLSVLALLATVAVFAITAESQANGLFRRQKGCCEAPSCAPACAAPCAADCAPAPIQYEERKVTCYKQVMVEKDVEVLVCKNVTTEQKYTYTVCVPVTTQVKRMETYCTPVTKEVDYTYTVMVPRTMQKTVACTTYQCVTEMVKECVPVCKIVRNTCVDECGRCHTTCERVTVMEERTRCVTKRIPITTEQVVNYTVCEPVTKAGKRTVCEYVSNQREVLVNVCSYQNVEKVGTRMVCTPVTEKVIRKVSYCTTVPYETTVKVAIAPVSTCSAPSCDSCAPACDSCGHTSHHRRGGLFRRGSSCCN